MIWRGVFCTAGEVSCDACAVSYHRHVLIIWCYGVRLIWQYDRKHLMVIACKPRTCYQQAIFWPAFIIKVLKILLIWHRCSIWTVPPATAIAGVFVSTRHQLTNRNRQVQIWYKLLHECFIYVFHLTLPPDSRRSTPVVRRMSVQTSVAQRRSFAQNPPTYLDTT